MIKNSQSMTAMKLTARYAERLCARFTAQFQRTLKALGSIQPIRNKRHTALTSTYANVLGRWCTLQARALKGAHCEPPTRRARWVAVSLVGALCLPMSHASSGSIDAIQSIKELADTQLTEKQEYCHNQIVYRESRFINDASNGSHHGYYQGKSKVLDGAPDDYQFYWFYHYTMHRYGLDPINKEIPNYCASLKHLKTKGWQ